MASESRRNAAEGERADGIIFETRKRSVRLNQIRLSGFKSFVDPTSIHFPGQLVGIVGPNGCGKSNVIDAVRWVLGETRASALRGDSMQDVIFNGSGNRKPLARASVELLFDNSLGRAGGQWQQYAEIAVKRVLQRDGESSYYINNQHVRRRDVTDMFLGTGLGPRAYAIIEQGMISRVIEAKPEELRVFLEEAAGISRYKERRRETEHRLADTRENLARVNDIRLELGAQIDKLEAQAQVATRYQALQGELQLKQQLLWYLRRRDAAAERERHAQEIARSGNALEAETATLREVESRVETSRAAHYAAGDAMNASQAALYEANAEVARLESELRYAEEARQRLEVQHTERRAQLTSWREQRAQLTQALHLWAARATEAKRRVLETKEKLQAQHLLLPQAEQAFRAAQERLESARSALSRAESRLQLEQANGAHLERAQQALEQRRERLEAELATLAEPEAAALQTIGATIAELEQRSALRNAGASRCRQSMPRRRSRAQAAEALGRAARARGRACPTRHPAPDPGRGRGQRAAAGMARAARAGPRRAPVAEAAHRPRLGDCGGGRAARAAARPGAHGLRAPCVRARRSSAGKSERVRSRRPAGRSRCDRLAAGGEDPRHRPRGRRSARRLARGRSRGGRHSRRAHARGPAERRNHGEPRRPSVHPPYRELPRARSRGCRPACAPGRDRGAGQALRRARAELVGG
jgi:chromosome segregation ATPase